MELYQRPLRLKTNLITYLIPGGRLIDQFFGNPEKGTSQVWIASVVQSVLEGAADSRSYLVDEDGGHCLAELLQNNPGAYLGKDFAARYGATPGFLLKLLNSRDRLLAQVHPNKEKAMKYFHSPFGKTEAWYVLGTEPGKQAWVWAGFKSGVTKDYWKQLILEQDSKKIMDCMHRFEIHEGDVIFIPAGLPHAMGQDSLVAEIQEPTDITLRAERFRPDGSELSEESLHSGIGYDGLMDCFDFDGDDEATIRERIFVKPQVHELPGGTTTQLIGSTTTNYFSMDLIQCHSEENQGAISCLRKNDRFAVVLVLDGQGWIAFENERIPIRKGSELFLPHGLKEYHYIPMQGEQELKLLECMPPEL